jgi:hypothetical protein
MKKINHTAYPRSLRNKSDDMLRYIIKDANEALFCFPECDKAGYYADEINYCSMELNKRAAARAKS